MSASGFLADTAQVSSRFVPAVPKTIEETGLSPVFLESLILKLLLQQGSLSGRHIANELGLHFQCIEPLLAEMKERLFVSHRKTVGLGDFLYVLSDEGVARAQSAMNYSGYVGKAPVIFEHYVAAISMQSIRLENPSIPELTQAFGTDLMVNQDVFNVLGPAINSGRGLFLYGEPGNGKTSIAERISRCFQHDIYIPHALWIDGQVVKLFDPQCHQAVPIFTDKMPDSDQRWVKINRPVVVVGGELTLESLEIQFNELTKVSEAPLQLKANGGVFLIDDFGRQRVSHVALLNRWIVPLEKRIDYLTLANGKKIEAPFDELIIFSTNIDPKTLVDDAFLRRIPYKIHVSDPTEAEFKALFQFLMPRYDMQYLPEKDDNVILYLIETYYRGKRPFRRCQVRDLLEQIISISKYRREKPCLTRENFDMACRNYFTAMGAV
ncbi:MAG: AAA family ATPase [Cyanobacteria bacterium]|nr:AAA family ATPase [Cyanobacteriota bacterium]